MHDHGYGLADKLNLDYLVASLQFDALWLVVYHEKWAPDYDTETGICANSPMTQTFAGWNGAEVF